MAKKGFRFCETRNLTSNNDFETRTTRKQKKLKRPTPSAAATTSTATNGPAVPQVEGSPQQQAVTPAQRAPANPAPARYVPQVVNSGVMQAQSYYQPPAAQQGHIQQAHPLLAYGHYAPAPGVPQPVQDQLTAANLGTTQGADIQTLENGSMETQIHNDNMVPVVTDNASNSSYLDLSATATQPMISTPLASPSQTLGNAEAEAAADPCQFSPELLSTLWDMFKKGGMDLFAMGGISTLPSTTITGIPHPDTITLSVAEATIDPALLMVSNANRVRSREDDDNDEAAEETHERPVKRTRLADTGDLENKQEEIKADEAASNNEEVSDVASNDTMAPKVPEQPAVPSAVEMANSDSEKQNKAKSDAAEKDKDATTSSAPTEIKSKPDAVEKDKEVVASNTPTEIKAAAGPAAREEKTQVENAAPMATVTLQAEPELTVESKDKSNDNAEVASETHTTTNNELSGTEKTQEQPSEAPANAAAANANEKENTTTLPNTEVTADAKEPVVDEAKKNKTPTKPMSVRREPAQAQLPVTPKKASVARTLASPNKQTN